MAKRKPQELNPLDAAPPVKVKVEGQSIDYSEDVRKKVNTASRTSTACDRCRVRKMRCDDQPDGCTPCRQNHTECKTTDRITGKATVRGYVESLERKIQQLERSNRQLQTRLVSLGGDVPPSERTMDSNTSYRWQESQGPSYQPEGAASEGVQVNGQGGPPSNSTYESGDAAHLPDFRTGLSGSNYVGVSTANPLLSSIRGTSMNVLGTEIDLADYASADLDEPDPSRTDAQPVYNKSYRACIQTAFGTGPKLSKVELPPMKEGLEYAQIYFTGICPYLPILHQPTFMKMLTRAYEDPTFRPTIPETVMMHTMFAIVKFQLAIRGYRDETHQAELNQSSNFHYHYALGFFPQLMASHTLADVQALTLIGTHLRNFPKPGACWMIVSIVLNMAVEIGLHRSTRRWASTAQRPNALENEIRKRVFWALLTLLVSTSGHLGRPLALRSEDWDVEMPESIDDEFLAEDYIDLSKSGQYLYNNIYAIKRSPQTYVDTIHALEKRLQEWKEQWPPEVKRQSASENELGHSHAQYLEICPLQMRLLLRHPSLSLTSNVGFNRENLTICLEVSKQMLFHVRQLQKYRSLDGTWQTAAIYILAISTTLFAHWERKDQIDASAMATLKEEMAAWLSVIGDVAQLMGSGKKLQDAVRGTIERALTLLSQHLPSKNAQSLTKTNSAPSPPSSVHTPRPPADGVYHQPEDFPPYQSPDRDRVRGAQSHMNSHAASFVRAPAANVNVHTTSITCQQPPQYPYQGPYSSNPTTYEQQSYAPTNTLPATAAAANAYMSNYQQPHGFSPTYTSNPTFAADTTYYSPGSSSSWRQFTGDITSNIDPGTDYLSSASALMQLGRSEGSSQEPMPLGMDLRQGSNMSEGFQQNWPFLLYENNHPGIG